MSDFKTKMHQIRFPQTPLGELTALLQTSRPPSWIWGPTSNGKRGWKGRGLSHAKVNFLVTSLLSNGDIFNDYQRL